MARNNKEKNKPVIGMDFGNCYSFLSYISDFDDYRDRMYLILSYEFKSNVRETWCVILVSES